MAFRYESQPLSVGQSRCGRTQRILCRPAVGMTQGVGASDSSSLCGPQTHLNITCRIVAAYYTYHSALT